MGRSLFGWVAGLLLGLGLGYVLFSSTAGRLDPGLTRSAFAAHKEAPKSAQPQELEALEAPLPSPEQQPFEVLANDAPLPPISETRVSEALSRVALMTSKVHRGDEQIWGRILDHAGEGLAGAVVRAHAFDNLQSLLDASKVGQGAPSLSLQETVQEAAQAYQDSRASRFQASSDSQGNYRLGGLPKGSFQMQAYLEGYELKPATQGAWRVPTGTEFDFNALALVDVFVNVLLPDGEAAESAVILCQEEFAERGREQRWRWSPTDNRLRLPASKLTLRALFGVSGSDFNREDDASMRSQELKLELLVGEPQHVDLSLAGRSGIRGRASFPKDVVETPYAHVRLLSIGSAREVDLELLASSELESWVQNLGDFSFFDLEPGRYAVGIARSWGGPIEAHEIVEVGPGVSDVTLTLPAIDASKFVVARVQGPGGVVLNDVDFNFIHRRNDGGTSSSGVQTLRDADGAYFITVPANSRELFFGEPGPKTSFSLRVAHSSFGSQVKALDPAQANVEIQFIDAAELEVTIIGLAGSDYAGRVSVSMQERGDQHMWSMSHERVGRDGTQKIPARAPGDYEFKLMLNESGTSRGRATEIWSQPIALRSGPNAIQVSMPALYALDLQVPDAEVGARVSMARRVDGAPQSQSHRSGLCDANGQVRIDGILPGDYSLSATVLGKPRSMQITIPSGPIVFTANQE